MKLTISNILKIFSIVLAITFIGLGAFIVFSDAFNYIPLNYRIIFACLIVAYGTFRIITIIYNVRADNNIIDGEE